MAALETTVSGPKGPIVSLSGRVERGMALQAAVKHLQERILRDTAQLDALTASEGYSVVTHRGGLQVLSYEELQERNA